jgi:transposase-like protein
MKIVTFKQDNSAAGPMASARPGALPPATTKRWVASRKAAVVAAVHGGLLTVMEACRRYGLSPEEFAEWDRHYEADGLKGLRASSRLRQPPYPMN